jgi:hypothetical protein
LRNLWEKIKELLAKWSYISFFLDIFADTNYCFGFPHSNTIVAGLLLFNIMLPYCSIGLWMYYKKADFDAGLFLFNQNT